MKQKLSPKSDYTCSYCNKIFKDPITLTPCNDNSKRKLTKSLCKMIDQVKAFERQYTTTNSDLTTTIKAAATCLKSFDEEMQDLNTRNYAIPTMLIDDDIRQIEQKKEANVAVLKNTNSTK